MGDGGALTHATRLGAEGQHPLCPPSGGGAPLTMLAAIVQELSIPIPRTVIMAGSGDGGAGVGGDGTSDGDGGAGGKPFQTPFLTCWHCNALNVMGGPDLGELPDCVGCGRGLHLRIGVHETGAVLLRPSRKVAGLQVALFIQRAFRRWQAVKTVHRLR